MEPIAVLTGDLIASTTAAPAMVDRAMQALAEAARTLGHWAGHDTRFTRFRGDGWQIYLEKPELALRATLFLTAWLRACDAGLATRIAVAIARHDHLGASGLSGASGPAFERSGRALDTMQRSETVILDATPDSPSPESPPSPERPWQAAVLALAHWQAGHWSREQAEAMVLALSPEAPTQDQIALTLGITRQAVQARLKGAGLRALQPALAAFEGRR